MQGFQPVQSLIMVKGCLSEENYFGTDSRQRLQERVQPIRLLRAEPLACLLYVLSVGSRSDRRIRTLRIAVTSTVTTRGLVPDPSLVPL